MAPGTHPAPALRREPVPGAGRRDPDQAERAHGGPAQVGRPGQHHHAGGHGVRDELRHGPVDALQEVQAHGQRVLGPPAPPGLRGTRLRPPTCGRALADLSFRFLSLGCFGLIFLNFNMGYFLCDLRHFFGFDITFLNVKVNQKSYNFLVLATAVRLLPFLLFLNSTDEGRCFLALLPQEVEGTKGGPRRGWRGEPGHSAAAGLASPARSPGPASARHPPARPLRARGGGCPGLPPGTWGTAGYGLPLP